MTDFVVADSGIRQLQARYIAAVWRKDFEAFGDCFTEDGEWRIAGRVCRGRAQCVSLLAEFIGDLERVRMTMQSPILQVGEGTAIGRTDVIEHNILKDRQRRITIGVYYDRFVEQGDRWRFAWHHYQLYYLGPPDMSGQFYELKDYGPPLGMPAPDEPTAPL